MFNYQKSTLDFISVLLSTPHSVEATNSFINLVVSTTQNNTLSQLRHNSKTKDFYNVEEVSFILGKKIYDMKELPKLQSYKHRGEWYCTMNAFFRYATTFLTLQERKEVVKRAIELNQKTLTNTL